MREIGSQNFEYDIFLGGPPDRRSPFPYKADIKEALPELAIYDWENYTGDDYQAHNNEALQKSLMMVSLVPDFPMPGIGPELGYFYAVHQARIKKAQAGLYLGLKDYDEMLRDGDIECDETSIPAINRSLRHCQKLTDPISYVFLIWPDSVQPDFAKKTIRHYGLILPTVEETITAVKASLSELQRWLDYQHKLKMDQARINTNLAEARNRQRAWRWKSEGGRLGHPFDDSEPRYKG